MMEWGLVAQPALRPGAPGSGWALAIVRRYGGSHAQDVEKPHSGIAGCNEQALINAIAIEYHDNAAADMERRFPPRPARIAPGLPAS